MKKAIISAFLVYSTASPTFQPASLQHSGSDCSVPMSISFASQSQDFYLSFFVGFSYKMLMGNKYLYNKIMNKTNP